MIRKAALSTALAFASTAGCSSPSPAPTPSSCPSFDYATYAPRTSPVSFKTEVVPIFATACSFSTCHASQQNPMGGLYLGPNLNNTQDKPNSVAPFYPPDDATLAKIHGGAVGVKSKLAVTMLVIQPSSPKDSFLMHKVEGDQGCAGIACNAIATGTCGETMPQGSPRLEKDASSTIRDWIAQGAANQ